jgi:hypothetical protein
MWRRGASKRGARCRRFCTWAIRNTYRRVRAGAGRAGPTKCVHSAKSWLSNPEVDRTAKILPWDAQAAGRVLSPVEVSTRILKHLADAWQNQQGSRHREHNVVLTVPASFDEEARELTVAGGARGGNRTADAARRTGRGVLFVDRQRSDALAEEPVRRADRAGLRRRRRHQRFHADSRRAGRAIASISRAPRSGKHLLLGGDNLDLTLAWLVESKLGKTLSIRQRSGLRRQCAAAKEQLLSDPNLKSVEVTVLGGGSSLVGGTLKHRDPARRGSGAGARRIPCRWLRAARQTEGGREEFVSRARPALRFRPGDHAPSGRVPGKRGRRQARCDFVQRRIFHSRRFCASASPTFWNTGTGGGP